MDSKLRTKKKNKKSNQNESKGMLGKIRSKYILQKVFNNMPKYKLLNIVKFNKEIQQKLNIDINSYKEYSEIEIEIIPYQNNYVKFININNKNEEKYYHIYLMIIRKKLKEHI